MSHKGPFRGSATVRSAPKPTGLANLWTVLKFRPPDAEVSSDGAKPLGLGFIGPFLVASTVSR